MFFDALDGEFKHKKKYFSETHSQVFSWTRHLEWEFLGFYSEFAGYISMTLTRLYSDVKNILQFNLQV